MRTRRYCAGLQETLRMSTPWSLTCDYGARVTAKSGRFSQERECVSRQRVGIRIRSGAFFFRDWGGQMALVTLAWHKCEAAPAYS